MPYTMLVSRETADLIDLVKKVIQNHEIPSKPSFYCIEEVDNEENSIFIECVWSDYDSDFGNGQKTMWVPLEIFNKNMKENEILSAYLEYKEDAGVSID